MCPGPLTSSSSSSSAYSLFSSGGGSSLFHSRLFASPSPVARLYASPASARRFADGAELADDAWDSPRAEHAKALRLASGAHMIPHPEKRHKGGEDAYFLSEDGQVVGVADGVGGWALSGIDSGLYSKSLMAEAKKAVEAAKKAGVQPTRATDIMQKAYDHTKHLVGSSTAVILMAEGQSVKYSNLGDSGFMVIRGDKVAFRTREQTHAFNTPYQIGTGGDHPTDAEEGRVAVEEGDIIVLGTDGLFDNLFDDQIVEIVKQGRQEKRDADEVAEMIARRAHKAGSRTTGEMPFGKNARTYGYQYQGGKMDDITVVVSFVSSSPSAPISPPSSPQQKAKF